MICFLIAVMIVSSMSLVSAGYHEIRAHDGKIALDGHSFNIVDGYVEDMDLQILDKECDPQNKIIRYSQVVYNQTNSSNYYSIVLIFSDNGDDLSGAVPDVNFTNTTIKGIEGHLIEMENETVFSYPEDGSIIEIHSNLGSEIFEKIL